jgi:putative ABC transport system ATP-binding protein
MADLTASTDLPAPIVAEGLVKAYGGTTRPTTVLRGVSLTVEAGEWVAIMGPSGCGKSTLLNLLGGLDVPDEGSVQLAGRQVDGRSETARARLRRDHVGYVFQQFNLVPHLDVSANVELPLTMTGVGRRAARARSRELLEVLGLTARSHAYPATLSGGEQQRVALARAVAARPAVLLADEPTGALDTEAARAVLGVLREQHRQGQTIVMVTHDHRVAAAADRVVLMRDGEVVDQRTLADADLSGDRDALEHLVSLEAF